MYKIGDKIKVLDDSQMGVVVKVSKREVTILNEYGFEETYEASELILYEKLEVGDFEILTKEEQRKNNFQGFTHEEPKEIDLHIGQLVDFTSGMSNFEMLRLQLDKVRYEIELARKEKRNRLIFIHGHGSGKLKEELHKLLNAQNKLEYYDASFRKYKLGATEVRLF